MISPSHFPVQQLCKMLGLDWDLCSKSSTVILRAIYSNQCILLTYHFPDQSTPICCKFLRYLRDQVKTHKITNVITFAQKRWWFNWLLCSCLHTNTKRELCSKGNESSWPASLMADSFLQELLCNSFARSMVVQPVLYKHGWAWAKEKWNGQ